MHHVGDDEQDRADRKEGAVVEGPGRSVPKARLPDESREGSKPFERVPRQSRLVPRGKGDDHRLARGSGHGQDHRPDDSP